MNAGTILTLLVLALILGLGNIKRGLAVLRDLRDRGEHEEWIVDRRGLEIVILCHEGPDRGVVRHLDMEGMSCYAESFGHYVLLLFSIC